MTESSAEELAVRSQNGCQASFAELVRRYGGRLLALAQQRTGNLHDAEDLVQDTFVKAYQNIHRYRNSFRFSTWLFTIAMRLADSYYRRRQTLPSVSQVPSDDSSPDTIAADKESRQNLWALAKNLTTCQHQALWLKYAEDMSIKEIAQVMRKSQVSVKVLLYRARMNLAGQLKNSAAGDETVEIASCKENLSCLKIEGAKCSAGSLD